MSSAAGRRSSEFLRQGDEPFCLRVQEDGANYHLRLTGPLEWESVGRVEAAVEQASQAGARRVVIDLRGLALLDLAGLRALLRANDRARGERFELIVVRPPRPVNRIFTLTRAGKELTMVDVPPGGGVG